MTIGRLVDAPAAARPTFHALCQLERTAPRADPRLGPELSPGITDHYPVAVEEGVIDRPRRSGDLR